MKLEDLTQDKLDEILAAQAAQEDSLKGLRADLAKAKAKAKGADIDPEAHAALQTQVEELQATLDKVQKESKKTIDKLTSDVGAKDGALQKYLIDAQLTESLSKAGVKPEFMDAAKALLKSGATIKSDNGEYAAVIGDKAISEHVKEWASSDTGKHFVAPPNNNGGGANGGAGGQGGKTLTRAEFETKSPSEKMEFAKAGGKII